VVIVQRISNRHILNVPALLEEARTSVNVTGATVVSVSGLQAHNLIQIYTNTDYCLVAFSTWIPPTSLRGWRWWSRCGEWAPIEQSELDPYDD
jgi:hypothetical protein